MLFDARCEDLVGRRDAEQESALLELASEPGDASRALGLAAQEVEEDLGRQAGSSLAPHGILELGDRPARVTLGRCADAVLHEAHVDLERLQIVALQESFDASLVAAIVGRARRQIFPQQRLEADALGAHVVAFVQAPGDLHDACSLGRAVARRGDEDVQHGFAPSPVHEG